MGARSFQFLSFPLPFLSDSFILSCPFLLCPFQIPFMYIALLSFLVLLIVLLIQAFVYPHIPRIFLSLSSSLLYINSFHFLFSFHVCFLFFWSLSCISIFVSFKILTFSFPSCILFQLLSCSSQQRLQIGNVNANATQIYTESYPIKLSDNLNSWPENAF